MGKKTLDNKAEGKKPFLPKLLNLLKIGFNFLSALLILVLIANVVDFHSEPLKQALMGINLYAFIALAVFWFLGGVLNLVPEKKETEFNPEELENKQAAGAEKIAELEKKLSEQSDQIQKLYGDEVKKFKEENESLKAELERIAQEENENIRKEIEELREKNNGLIDQLKSLAAGHNDAMDTVGDIHAA